MWLGLELARNWTTLFSSLFSTAEFIRSSLTYEIKSAHRGCLFAPTCCSDLLLLFEAAGRVHRQGWSQWGTPPPMGREARHRALIIPAHWIMLLSRQSRSTVLTQRRYSGDCSTHMGDGVLVYFGYPEAHEDDPERAVRAGLELVAEVGVLKTHASLAARVGIATGLVVVGDLIGSGAAQEQAIVGKMPNLAAGLQGVAAPNMVVIAEGTRKLVGNWGLG